MHNLKKSRFLQYAFQDGRSMVEMLGVLAIIGVLSIGGIAGYTTAMSYYKANEILNDVNLRAAMVVTDIATNGILESGEYITDLSSENNLGNTFLIEPAMDDKFTITVSTVDEGTCENLLNRDGKGIFEITLERTECAADDNILIFTFANDLGALVNADAGMEDDLNDCTNKPLIDSFGVCYACDEPARLYVLQKDDCITVCPDERKWDLSSCVLNSDTCPVGYPLRGATGGCYDCNEPTAVPVNRPEDCAVCQDERKYYASYCSLRTCPAEYPLRDGFGGCHACNELIGVDVRGVEDNCMTACPDERKLYNSSCSLKLCPEGYPIQVGDGSCFSCTVPQPLFMLDDADDCVAACNGIRVLGGSGNSYCTLPCDEDKPLMDKEGQCHACNETGSVYVTDIEDNCTTACPDERYLDGHLCKLKS